ncbi:MarR family transcriptional regulator [Actinoplanes sp. G11-F43]|uniref:MarR family transcriptional regulator n=1 Tax=Actinoplanes sp. G11-F43 TaxID=3424130 RepID=UPI003D32B7F8
MTIDQRSDEELAAQPAAYWTRLAYEATIGFTRARQAEAGFTQPQFWLLRNLSRNDLWPDGRGRTIAELTVAMAGYLRAEDDLTSEAETSAEKGWLTSDAEDRWWITDEGEKARLEMKAVSPGIRARIHEGIDDADYVTALRVLLRMIDNVER